MDDNGWFKSSYSGAGNCVEVRLGAVVLTRDSKDPEGPALAFSVEEWAAFLRGVKDGTFS